MARISKKALVFKIAIVVAAFFVALHAPAAIRATPAEGTLRLDFLDVGQGDSILLTSSGGFQMLIDGGPDQAVLEQLRSAMEPSDRFIDVIVLSHPDADHLTGLMDVVRDYVVARVFMPDVEKDTALYRAWEELLEEQGIETTRVREPQRVQLPDGIQLFIVHPSPLTYNEGEAVNDASLVMRLEHGERSFLFTGDIEKTIEERLVEFWPDAIDADVLKVPHHGSKSSSTPAFIRAVSPALAVVQVGRENRYGHPAAIVLDRYRRQNIDIWRNDYLGDISLESDGKSVWKAGSCLALAAPVFPCKPEKVYTFSQDY